MVSMMQLWLPILLSAVFAFFASSVLNMLLKFWHVPDYRGFSNEEEIGIAIRKTNPPPGMYMFPHCSPDAMRSPETREKFRQGPVGVLFLRQCGEMNMGGALLKWFLFCLLVSVLSACLATHTLVPTAPGFQVFHVIGLAAFLGYSLGSVPNGIWWGHPWGSVLKYIVDGLIYSVITAATFVWLWPH